LFNSLCTSNSSLNSLLKFLVDFLLQESIQLQVLHIAGEDNHIADALSCC
ncbi:hypothetical protein BDQ17DRAFT_1241078, partial [Cyathus striatus]